MLIFSMILLLLLVFFIVIGRQFRRGKWLRLIAGNTTHDLPKKVEIQFAKKTGLVMYSAGAFCLFIAWWLLFSDNQLLLWLVFGAILILSGIILVINLRRWIKDGY